MQSSFDAIQISKLSIQERRFSIPKAELPIPMESVLSVGMYVHPAGEAALQHGLGQSPSGFDP